MASDREESAWEAWSAAALASPRETEPAEFTNTQKMFVLLAEIRQCINDDNLMTAQRKVMAIESLLKPSARLSGSSSEERGENKKKS